MHESTQKGGGLGSGRRESPADRAEVDLRWQRTASRRSPPRPGSPVSQARVASVNPIARNALVSIAAALVHHLVHDTIIFIALEHNPAHQPDDERLARLLQEAPEMIGHHHCIGAGA